jgi:hypothetical protein
MRKSEALKLIDDHKNKLVNPVEMLHWCWLRVIVLCIDDEQWDELVGKAADLILTD